MEQQTLLIKAEGKTLEEKYADAIKKLKERGIDVLVADNGIKNTEKAPKYDPCRKFKKGDVVRVVERHERYQPNIPVDELWKDLCTVAEDEDFCNNLVKVRSKDGREKLSHWWYLELVTPVEERYPYIVSNDDTEFSVFDRMRRLTVCSFDICHPHAEEAAEAECARLNAEYRKEQK